MASPPWDSEGKRLMRPSGSCQRLGGTTATFVPCRLDSAAPLRTPASGLRMLARLADCRIAVDIETIGIVEVAALAARARWLAAGAFSCSRSSLSGRPTPAFASTEGERRRRRAHNRSNATSTKVHETGSIVEIKRAVLVPPARRAHRSQLQRRVLQHERQLRA
jgi:hypothetical protein